MTEEDVIDINQKISAIQGYQVKIHKLQLNIKEKLCNELKELLNDDQYDVGVASNGIRIELTLPIPLPVMGKVASMIDDSSGNGITGIIHPMGNMVRLDYSW